MPLSFLPRLITDSLTDVTPEFLRSRDIRLLMLDFDNTIVPYTTNIPTTKIQQWLQDMTASDITLCVVSNSRNDRVQRFCANYGIPCITRAKKPSIRGIREALAKFGVAPANAAIAGDQIFTDTLGGNRAGVTSILVKPIHNHNFWLKARHVLEQPFIYIARKRRINL